MLSCLGWKATYGPTSLVLSVVALPAEVEALAFGADKSTPGAGLWYVVRERRAACGIGTYGYATGGVERVSTGCP